MRRKRMFLAQTILLSAVVGGIPPALPQVVLAAEEHPLLGIMQSELKLSMDKLVAQGLVLATIIVHDAWREARRNLRRGERKALLDELRGRQLPLAPEPDDEEQGSENMQRRHPDRAFAMGHRAGVTGRSPMGGRRRSRQK